MSDDGSTREELLDADRETGRFRDDVDPESTTALLIATVGGAQTWGPTYGEDARDELAVVGMETLIEGWLVV